MTSKDEELEALRGRLDELEELLGLRQKFKLPRPIHSKWDGPTIQRLLGLLLSSSPRVVPRDFSIRAAMQWRAEPVYDKTLDTYIYRLRRMGIDVRTARYEGHWIPEDEAVRIRQKLMEKA